MVRRVAALVLTAPSVCNLRPCPTGHGGTQEDPTGQEWRGNQTICPCDYQQAGVITDSKIHEMLVQPLPQVGTCSSCSVASQGCADHPSDQAAQLSAGAVCNGRGSRTKCCARHAHIVHSVCSSHCVPPVLQNTTLHALIDSCHSGTVMNLPYNAVLQTGSFSGWEEEYPGKSWKKVRMNATTFMQAGCTVHRAGVCYAHAGAVRTITCPSWFPLLLTFTDHGGRPGRPVQRGAARPVRLRGSHGARCGALACSTLACAATRSSRLLCPLATRP